MTDAQTLRERPPGLHTVFLETVASNITPEMVAARANALAPVLADLLRAESAVGHAMGEGLLNPTALAVARATVIDPPPAQEAPRG